MNSGYEERKSGLDRRNQAPKLDGPTAG